LHGICSHIAKSSICKVMKNTTSFLFITFLALGLFFTTSCRKKEDVKQTLESIQAAEDNGMVESEFDNAKDASDAEAGATPGVKRTTGIRRVIWVLPQDSAKTSVVVSDSGTYKKIEVNFGNDPVVCNDGKYRKGTIIYRVDTAFYKTTNAKASMTLLNYFAGFDKNNLTQFTGKRELTNNGKNTSGQPYFTLTVTGASAITGSKTITWTSTRVITRTAGYTTPLNIWDDEYSVTGTASGVNRNGEAFTVNITTPLYKKIKLGCASTFVTGVWELTMTSSSKKMILNYDAYNDGACDKVAKVTINGNDRIITVN
jgi:preprotein translocase subunit SecG